MQKKSFVNNKNSKKKGDTRYYSSFSQFAKEQLTGEVEHESKK